LTLSNTPRELSEPADEALVEATGSPYERGAKWVNALVVDGTMTSSR
jgi:hypothetical protein